MERIHYASGSVLTGSVIARALLEYGEALAEVDKAATVDVPARYDDGTVGHANFLLGPASQIVSETEVSDFAELVDDELVAAIVDATRKLRHVPIVRPDATYTAESADDLDFDLAYPETDVPE